MTCAVLVSGCASAGSVSTAKARLASSRARAPENVRGTWTELHPPENPLARDSAGFTYDAATGTVLLAGGKSGCGPDPTFYNDTWGLADGKWTRLHPANNGPGGEAFFTMTYDPASQQVVAVGIYTGCGTATVMHFWNGSDWSLPPSTLALPPPMSWSGLAYDSATGQLLLFGEAQTFDQTTQSNLDVAETWSWADGQWRELSPTTEPPLLADASMAYDPATRSVILFGGQPVRPTDGGGFGAPVDGTWSWNGSEWVQLTPPAHPSARTGSSLAYDPSLGGLVLFGGSTVDPGRGNVRPLNDMWLWKGGDWLPVKAPVMPSPRFFSQMTFDTASHELVLFGGALDNTADTNDAWVFRAR